MFRVMNCLEAEHDWRLVLLAAAVCFVTSLAAMYLYRRARAIRNDSRMLWLLTAGLVTGSGVWATHFIAMLAYSSPFPIQYDLIITTCSLVAATVMTTAGFAVALVAGGRQGAAMGGTLIGIGVACMHYMGMASLRVPATILWIPSLVIASILLGILLGAAALVVAQRSTSLFDLLAGATLLTLAVSSHHFTAMSAFNLVSRPALLVDANLLSPIELSLAIAAFTLAVVIAGIIGLMSDRRARISINKRNVQLDAALNNMGQGLCMFDADGRLELWNENYERMYRLPPGTTKIGDTLDQILAARASSGATIVNADGYSTSLKAAIADRVSISQMAELTDGRTIHVRYRPMESGGCIATHDDITERKRSEERIVHMALHDVGTDLPNRAAFNQHLECVFAEASNTKTSFAVARIDVDRFKEINDVFGHATGDAVLSGLAKKLEDVCDGSFLARLGGDEFSLITWLGHEPRAAEDLCARLSGVLTNAIQVNRQTVHVGCTIGISIYPNDGTDVETLNAHAGVALFSAKSEDRGTIRFFEASMDLAIRERRLLQRDLIVALENRQFELYFQPQATTTGAIVAFEVLLRWRHPERGLLSPVVFIPLAEETGLIGAIDEWVLREACREAASWPNPVAIAVNLSPVDFRAGDVVTMLKSVLAETGLDPRRLEIEITEGVLIDDFSRAISILHNVKALNVRVAMDDFGSGYSSLSYLQSFPFDKIKIDRSFVSKLDENPQSAAIIHAIIGLGRSLKLPVIAEGVETAAQLAFLTAEGCAEIQGYLIGRPQPISYYHKVVVDQGHDTPQVAVGW